MSLSVVINTKNAVSGNSQHDFSSTLDSVRFADEIVIVDMQSTDNTIEIAKKYTTNIYDFEDVGFVEPARNFAIEKATKDWILIVDADEVISESLKEKIEGLISGDATADAYALPRKNIVFGKWYQHAGWWPDYQLRLFRNGAVEWSDKIHSVPVINGSSDKLAQREDYAIIHHNYQSVEQFITRMNRYTTHEANQRDQNVVSGASVISSFEAELMSRLFLHRGIDAGVHGVGISFLQSFYEVAVKLKQWELQGFSESRNQKEAIAELDKLQRNLNYWIADWHAKQNKGIAKVIWKLRRKLGV